MNLRRGARENFDAPRLRIKLIDAMHIYEPCETGRLILLISPLLLIKK